MQKEGTAESLIVRTPDLGLCPRPTHSQSPVQIEREGSREGDVGEARAVRLVPGKEPCEVRVMQVLLCSERPVGGEGDIPRQGRGEEPAQRDRVVLGPSEFERFALPSSPIWRM